MTNAFARKIDANDDTGQGKGAQARPSETDARREEILRRHRGTEICSGSSGGGCGGGSSSHGPESE